MSNKKQINLYKLDYESIIAVIEDENKNSKKTQWTTQARSVLIDLTYTDKIDNKSSLRDLREKFGQGFVYFQHLSSSYGGFEDVVRILRRD